VAVGVVVALIAGLTVLALPPRPAEALSLAPQYGYWLVASDGGIFAFGQAQFYGSTGSMKLVKPVVGMAATPTGKGYWLVASDGGIFAFGDAGFYGSTGAMKLNQPIVGMARTPSGQGYWLVASDGGIFAFGDARFFGSTGGSRLRMPIAGMAATPSGNGYWLVAADGGIFTFGDAPFLGSGGAAAWAGGPITGMAATPTGKGYWLLLSDGGLLYYGDAQLLDTRFHLTRQTPAVGVVSVGRNYWLAASDGGLYNFGDAPFLGSAGNVRLARPIVGMAGGVWHAPADPQFEDVLPAQPTVYNALRVALERPRVGYSPEAFGTWTDADADGCDTRAEVLIADSQIEPVVGPACAVGGRWLDAYDGSTTSDPLLVDVDQIVPIAEAWDSGADAWDAARREAFANDLEYEDALMAVLASSKAARAEADPATWMPARAEFRCEYAQRWVAMKYRWRLSADPAEAAALDAIFAGCPGGLSPSLPARAPASPPLPVLAFGQMQCNAPGTDDDQNINDEWVDIANTGATAADLDGYTVTDAGSNAYLFDEPFILAAGASVKLHTGTGTDTATDRFWGRSSHVWSNSADNATLNDADGNTVATKAC
jgi:hypothetical protein